MARDVLLEQRPDRGTWDLVRGPDGNPVSTESEQHAVLTQLYEQRGAPGDQQPGHQQALRRVGRIDRTGDNKRRNLAA